MVGPRKYNTPCSVYSVSDDRRERVLTGWCRVEPRMSARLWDLGEAIPEVEYTHVIRIHAPVARLAELERAATYVKTGDGRVFAVTAWTATADRSELLALTTLESNA